METELDFWMPIAEIPLIDRPTTNDYCVPIKVKSTCFSCGRIIKIHTTGDKNKPSIVYGCSCPLPYYKFWELRIKESIKNINPTNDGCRCKSCKDWYPFAISNQADGTMICWSCRQ